MTFGKSRYMKNKNELECYFKVKIKDDEVVEYAKKLVEKGAQNVLVSDGRSGSYLVTHEGSYRIKGVEKDYDNTVGAGDSQVAGFIANYLVTHDSLEAYAAAHQAALAFLEQDYNKTYEAKIEEIK